MSARTEPLPPHDLEAEKCLIASMLLCDGNAEIYEAILAMKPGFYLPDHEVIFATLGTMYRGGREIDAISLQAELAPGGRLAEIGGIAYLADLLNTVPAWTHWRTYAGIVVDMHQRRKLIGLADFLTAQAMLPRREIGALEVAEAASKRIAGIVETGTTGQYHKIGDLAMEVMDALGNGEAPYIPSGIGPLDEAIGGFGQGEFWIIGARPSMGKSTLVRQMAMSMAAMGTPIGFISLEEGTKKIARNILASEAGVDNHRIRNSTISGEEGKELYRAVQKLSTSPLYISNTARRITDIRALAAAWKAREKIEVLIIDYLQRVRASQIADRYSAVTEISLELSDLAKSTGLTVICPAQLNRGVEGRPDKRPNMADLRESGQIEQDADGIIFLHREDYYHTDDRSYTQTGIAELIIAKNRDGIRGKKIEMRSDLRHQRFVENTDF